MDENKFDKGIKEDRNLDNYDEETAADMTDTDLDSVSVEEDTDNDADLNNVYGWVAVALSVLAFFMAPVLFAAAGIIVGFIARQKDAPILGYTAITLGVLALIARFFIIPMI